MSKKTQKTPKPGNLAVVHPSLVAPTRAVFSAFRPTSKLTLSEWADTKRQLSREGSAEPGQWRTSWGEYQRGIMDAVTDRHVHRVVVLKGSQVGWTEILNNAIGYHMEHDPASILAIQPTIETAQSWSKERLAPMLRDTKCLAQLVKDPRSRDSGNTLRHKEFPGGYLAIIGANAPSGLASRPIRVVLADEVDRYPHSAGTEGDPLKLADKRQVTYWNRKTLIGSTPTVQATSVIVREYENSDMRKFMVPCPHCGTRQELRWSQVKWDKTEDGTHLPETAHYLGECCGALWTDVERWRAIRDGEWEATAPFRGIAGFFLPQLYSSKIKLSEMAQEFVDAQGDPTLLQVFVNTVLAEAWREQGERADPGGLKAKVEGYSPMDLPSRVAFATAGVDTQDDRLEVEVVGWGEGDESWGIEYEVLYGDPAQQKVWQDLDDLLKRRYWTEEGRLVRIKATAIDTGGHHAASVYAFCKSRLSRGVYPIAGSSGPKPIWPLRASKAQNNNRVFMVGVDTAKEAVYGRYKIPTPPPEHEGPVPGACHFPLSYDDEWFEQATSEDVVTRYREGRPYRVWILPSKKRNEALDCRVYATAALWSLSKRQRRPSPVVAETPEAKHRVDIAVETHEEQIERAPRRRGRRQRSKGI